MGLKTVDFDKELTDAQKESAAILRVAIENGFVPDKTEWLTIKDYAAKYSLSAQVVADWISIGIIPEDSTMVLLELNDIRLIKDQFYKWVFITCRYNKKPSPDSEGFLLC